LLSAVHANSKKDFYQKNFVVSIGRKSIFKQVKIQ
jgi:hypothetical protein